MSANFPSSTILLTQSLNEIQAIWEADKDAYARTLSVTLSQFKRSDARRACDDILHGDRSSLNALAKAAQVAETDVISIRANLNDISERLRSGSIKLPDTAARAVGDALGIEIPGVGASSRPGQSSTAGTGSRSGTGWGSDTASGYGSGTRPGIERSTYTSGGRDSVLEDFLTQQRRKNDSLQHEVRRYILAGLSLATSVVLILRFALPEMFPFLPHPTLMFGSVGLATLCLGLARSPSLRMWVRSLLVLIAAGCIVPWVIKLLVYRAEAKVMREQLSTAEDRIINLRSAFEAHYDANTFYPTSLQSLASPVIYFSSGTYAPSVFLDPFSVGGHDQFRFARQGDLLVIVSVGRSQGMRIDFDNDIDWRNGRVKPELWAKTYDPTNGLLSDGNIIRFGRFWKPGTTSPPGKFADAN